MAKFIKVNDVTSGETYVNMDLISSICRNEDGTTDLYTYGSDSDGETFEESMFEVTESPREIINLLNENR